MVMKCSKGHEMRAVLSSDGRWELLICPECGEDSGLKRPKVKLAFSGGGSGMDSAFRDLAAKDNEWR